MRRDQRGGFLRVGLENIHHHVLIDDSAIGEHKVRCPGAAQGQQNHQRFTDKGDIKQAENNHPATKQNQRHGRRKQEIVQMRRGNNLPAALNKQGIKESKEQGATEGKFNIVTL
ncbi:hypothetical protein D3C81_1945560 [compost metagenome]